MWKKLILIGLCSAVAALTGCGIKGDLYLPGEPAPHATNGLP